MVLKASDLVIGLRVDAETEHDASTTRCTASRPTPARAAWPTAVNLPAVPGHP
jgi:hypothetical protein